MQHGCKCVFDCAAFTCSHLFQSHLFVIYAHYFSYMHMLINISSRLPFWWMCFLHVLTDLTREATSAAWPIVRLMREEDGSRVLLRLGVWSFVLIGFGWQPDVQLSWFRLPFFGPSFVGFIWLLEIASSIRPEPSRAYRWNKRQGLQSLAALLWCWHTTRGWSCGAGVWSWRGASW